EGGEMDQFECRYCQTIFISIAERDKHTSRCAGRLLKITPSFKTKLSPKNERVRSRIKGSYEWALKKRLPKSETVSKFWAVMDKKCSTLDLEKEVVTLERKLVSKMELSKNDLNRQIVLSHLLKQRIEKAPMLRELDKQIEQRKRDRSQGSALGSQFDQKYSLFVSGGAPGLGKRA
ncbi:TPA: hypothetical protein ACF5BV_004858, partial [Vibrio parahaemolyticus]